MLDDCLAYLEKRAKKSSEFTYEVIVVDDGSKDRTSDVAFEYSKKYPLYVHKLDKNAGKGGAVRCGVLCSRGSLILFADADGATKFEDFGKLEDQILEMRKDNDAEDFIAIGSR
jgi:dolichyl-phosphate beta-glucosyltransferase